MSNMWVLGDLPMARRSPQPLSCRFAQNKYGADAYNLAQPYKATRQFMRTHTALVDPQRQYATSPGVAAWLLTASCACPIQTLAENVAIGQHLDTVAAWV